MTKHEAAVFTAFTNIYCSSFAEFHKYANKIMGRPLLTHEFAEHKLQSELKEKSRKDFENICNNLTD